MATLRARLTFWLERRWYGTTPPGLFLRLLAQGFGKVVAARRKRFLAACRHGDAAMTGLAQRVDVPVIVVGNLAVGGAGKTPLVVALVEALRARGFRPGVISRGYGRRGTGVQRVRVDAEAEAVGDEPLLIVRQTGAPLAVAARRIEAARLLVQTGEVDVLVADDGLQHYALARDIEILVVDGERRFGNARLLPAGPLRELPARAAECDFIVVNGGVADAGEIPMRLELADAVSLADGQVRELSGFSGRHVHAVAGIGNPGRFFRALRECGLDPVEHAFPDHHAFTADDLAFADDLPVLMTSKDAVKCRAFVRAEWYEVPVRAQLPDGFFDGLAARLVRLGGSER